MKIRHEITIDDYIGKLVSRNSGMMNGILGRLTKNSQGYWLLYFDGSSCKVNESMLNLTK